MTEDGLTKVKILKFVRLLDGGETEESLVARAQSRNWLDSFGTPTVAGIQLVRSSDRMSRLVEPDLIP